MAVEWRNSPLAAMAPSTAAKSMANPVTVVTVARPAAVERGGTPDWLRPARLFSSSANSALSAAATASRP